MLVPDIKPWVEKSNWELRVVQKSGNVSPFVEVADLVCAGQIFRTCFSSVFNADYVVNMEYKKRILGWQTAIFTAMLGSLGNQSSEGVWDVAAHSQEACERIFASRTNFSKTM